MVTRQLLRAARAAGLTVWDKGGRVGVRGPGSAASLARSLLEVEIDVLAELDRQARVGTQLHAALLVAAPRPEAANEPGSPCVACGGWTPRALLSGDVCVRCAVVGQATEDDARWQEAFAAGRGPAEECERLAREWTSSRAPRPALEPPRSARGRRGAPAGPTAAPVVKPAPSTPDQPT